jgi:hypothetical protein
MRSDAARLIGENLHSLPAVGGRKPMRMFNFASKAHGDSDIATQITQAALLAGESIVQLLENNGYTVTHRDDPTPADVDPGNFPHVVVRCEHCTEAVLTVARLTVDQHRKGRFHGTLHRVAIEGAGLKHPSGPHCWE